jgi:hypothetical protein
MIMAEEYRALSPNFADIELDGSFDDMLELADVGEPSSPYRYAPTNAVHMEIQENGKLPTFNLNVDRSNSSIVSRVKIQQPYSPTTRREIEEMMRLSENDFSLTEVFLKSNDRSSQNMNYSSAGAMLGSIGDQIGERRNETQASKLEETSNGEPAHKPDPLTVDGAYTSHQLHQPYYRRPNQLPIPTSAPDPEPKSDNGNTGIGMDAMVAIAAAIVSQVPSSDGTPAAETEIHAATPSPTSPTPLSQATTAPPLPQLTARPTAPISAPATPAPQPYQYPPPRSATDHPAAFPYSRLNAAATAPTPQIMSATKQRSQFGFGGDHQVPCIPNPPKRATTHKKKKPKTALVVATSPLPPSANSGPAYERKKQRAKDARCKLNDAIERMSISMSLAGTQSQQRALVHADPQTRKAMEECAEMADSAKKWDRPGFVGTAAQLIQCLNAQCEALVRELKRRESNGFHKRVDAPEEQQDLNAKRRKVDSTVENGDVHLVFCDSKLLQLLGSFLDPQSLLRCQLLTHTVRSVFSKDSLWLDRCIQRFGQFHVRQWKEKLDDEEEEGQPPCSCLLYRQMDAQNVKPHQSQLLVLAEARMPTKVSAWVNMVERSNGETCRSVRQEDGRYTSLPVVELRLLIQNTGSSVPIVIADQVIVVDASTRRRGEEWKEITRDERFAKRLLDSQESPFPSDDDGVIRLRLYESVVVVVHIHCKGCSTASKFQQRANFTKVLVQLNGSTVPLVIPFFRESQ